MLKLTPSSHLNHNLSAAHLEWILQRFGDRDAFFLEPVELPASLPSVPCGLHGPRVGDEPVPDRECRLEKRLGRERASRVCDRPMKMVRTLTVIAGPHGDDACVLYTAHGGPSAPREPWDPSLEGDVDARAASIDFWAEHALTAMP